MAIPVYPELVLPSSMSLNLVANTTIYESTFNRNVNTHSFAGDRWEATLNFDNLDNFTTKEIDILQAFIWNLGGANGRFYMWNLSRNGRPELGSPKVNGQNQYGKLLVSDGWLADSLVLRMGENFSVNGELKMATKDCYSSPTGSCNLEFTPPLRTSPPDNAEIKTERPLGLFRLSDDSQGVFNLSAGLEATVTISVVEAFNV